MTVLTPRMPRPRVRRRVGRQPEITFFKPAGIRMSELEEVIITVEELEALKLKDSEGKEQSEAAKKMGISQPTFHRLLVQARKKVADAISSGKAIRIEGGHFQITERACICSSCGHTAPKPLDKRCKDISCPECGGRMQRKL